MPANLTHNKILDQTKVSAMRSHHLCDDRHENGGGTRARIL